jgi:drug/metabolite transporter (DMT)-like permease
MIASVEPLAATVFTAILLGTKFTMIDIIGFLLIIATVILLAYKEEKKQHEKKKINKTSLT